MKTITKNIIVTIIVIVLALLINIILSNKENKTHEIVDIEHSPSKENQISTQKLTYSNLVDTATQEEVRAAMRHAGIAEDNINSFFDDVNNFNATVEEKTLVQDGFTTIHSNEPEYDLVSMMDMWDAENPLFIGYNCRITTYDLLKDLITIKNPNPENSDWMMFDKNALENNPKKLFTKDEYQDF